jgi:hypothetical protein
MKQSNTYKRHRFTPEIIQYAVWLYHRFNLSHHDIEDLLAQRGIFVSYESIRLWCNKFGPRYVQRLRRKHQGYGDTFSSMKCSLGFRESSIIYGVLWIRMVRLSMCFYSEDVMEKSQSASVGGYCANTKANLERLSPISSEVTELLIENLSLNQFTTPLRISTTGLSFRTNRHELDSGACVSSNRWSRHNAS